MSAETRRYPTRNTFSRRRFLENSAIIGGGLAVAASGVDAIGSASYVADQVNEELPYMLISKRVSSIRGIAERLSQLASRTSDQQAALDSAQTLVDVHTRNEELRLQRADKLQVESDDTPVLGTTRNSLRWKTFGAGVAAIALGVGNKIARAYGK